MSVEFDRGSPGKFDSRTLNRKLLIGGLGVVALDCPSVDYKTYIIGLQDNLDSLDNLASPR